MRSLPFDPIEEARRQWVEHGWGRAARGMAAVTSVMRVQQIFLARVEEQLRPLDLTFARFEVLMLLYFSQRRSLPLGRIGQLLQVHPTSVTSLVDRLERQGFVRRLPHPSDRRTTLATLTPAGEQVALRAVDGLNTEVFADLGVGASATDSLVDVLQRLRRDAGDFEQPGARHPTRAGLPTGS